MKIIKGNKRLHEYVDNYIKEHNEEQFLVIDNKNLDYKYSGTNVLIFVSNEKDWENNIKTCLQEKEDITYIFFTNVNLSLETLKYFNEEFNYSERKMYFVFSDDCENIIEEYEFLEEDYE